MAGTHTRTTPRDLPQIEPLDWQFWSGVEQLWRRHASADARLRFEADDTRRRYHEDNVEGLRAAVEAADETPRGVTAILHADTGETKLALRVGSNPYGVLVHLTSLHEELVDDVHARLLELFKQAAERAAAAKAGRDAERRPRVRTFLASVLVYGIATPLVAAGIIAGIVAFLD